MTRGIDPAADHPPHLILASGSPRRRALLEALGIPFEVMGPDVDERPRPGEDPRELVVRLAIDKASTASIEGRIALGADTEVVIDGEVLGKPATPEAARAMLGRIAGRAHTVLTGVAVAAGGVVHTALVSSRVVMAPMSGPEIEWYVGTGEPHDKAGAYALQGIGGAFVEGVEGSHSNVIGLPLVETVGLLRQGGLRWPPG